MRAKEIVQEREYLRDVHRRLMDRSGNTLAVSGQLLDALILLRAFLLLMMKSPKYVRHTSADDAFRSGQRGSLPCYVAAEAPLDPAGRHAGP